MVCLTALRLQLLQHNLGQYHSTAKTGIENLILQSLLLYSSPDPTLNASQLVCGEGPGSYSTHRCLEGQVRTNRGFLIRGTEQAGVRVNSRVEVRVPGNVELPCMSKLLLDEFCSKITLTNSGCHYHWLGLVLKSISVVYSHHPMKEIHFFLTFYQ